jgi:hypothetical protein
MHIIMPYKIRIIEKYDIHNMQNIIENRMQKMSL